MLHVVHTQQKLIAMTSTREARPCAFKFNPKTAGFGKVAKLHCSAACSVQKSQLCTVAKRQFNVHYSQIIPFGAYYSQIMVCGCVGVGVDIKRTSAMLSMQRAARAVQPVWWLMCVVCVLCVCCVCVGRGQRVTYQQHTRLIGVLCGLTSHHTHVQCPRGSTRRRVQDPSSRGQRSSAHHHHGRAACHLAQGERW